MKRTIIEIDEQLCNGCGICVEGCHEGALQLINGKAVMVSDLYCDGLGACIGDCPVGAIKLIERESVPYDEIAVMERISPKGESVILAHLKHLRDHDQLEWFNQGIDWCRKNGIKLDLSKIAVGSQNQPQPCGCPGSSEKDFRGECGSKQSASVYEESPTQLQQWPVQLHLLNPNAPFMWEADLLLASDCSAFSHGSFHNKFLKNKALAIACPKLDSNTNSYVEKITAMIDHSKLNTITVLMMEVPCCGGLVQIAKVARERASRMVPIKAITLSLRGEILKEEWV